MDSSAESSAKVQSSSQTENMPVTIDDDFYQLSHHLIKHSNDNTGQLHDGHVLISQKIDNVLLTQKKIFEVN